LHAILRRGKLVLQLHVFVNETDQQSQSAELEYCKRKKPQRDMENVQVRLHQAKYV